MWQEKQTVRWGIVGCGDVTERKSGPGFSNVGGFALQAVMRRDAAKAEDYARRHSVPVWTGNADELINHPEVDAVYVATPPGSHLEYALEVAKAGKPCLVEKPMARNVAECKRMVAAFRERGLPLFVAYYRRCLPRFIEARQIVDSGALGTLTSVLAHYASPSHRGLKPGQLPWRVQARHAGGGLFLDMGSHTLDFLDYLLGPLSDVRGFASNVVSPHAVEDVVQAQCISQSGVHCSLSWNFASGQHRDRLEIEGSRGRLSMTVFGNDPLRLETEDGVQELDRPNPDSVHQPLLQSIADALAGRGSCPSTGESALRTSQVMDTILDRYYGGRADAFWEREVSWPGNGRE